MLAVSAVWSLNVLAPVPAQASKCVAYVENAPRVVPVNFQSAGSVAVTYVTHSTFRLQTPAGVVIATD